MAIKTRKIGIIGAGNVGSHLGLQLAVQGLADEVVFYDTNNDKAVGESLDLMDAVSYQPHHFEAYAGTVADMKDADIIINASGKPRLPGQTRLDMMDGGIATTKEFLPLIEKSGFDGIIISISNPCDIIAEYIQYKLDWPKNKIIGSGTALDSARLQYQLSDQLKINRRSLTAYLLGEHGDSSMIPWSHVTVAGKKLDELLAEKPDLYKMDPKDVILEKVHREGYVENTTKGCTEFGVTSATAELVRAIYHNEHKVLPVSVYLDGPYGVKDSFASVPVKIGKDGVEDIIELHLTEEEQKEFEASIQVLKEHFARALTL
ncbi:MAG TPA: L-lactate dehydrogenase [Dialister sp.]|nr:L-lactate dehydrogenase [Dialister sp.]